MKAAIIDDNILFRYSLGRLLSRTQGLDLVGEADSIETGIRLLESTCPDIVFMDVEIKDGTGIDILLGSLSHDYDVIFNCSCDDSDHRVRSIRLAGFECYLKTGDTQEMLDVIAHCRYGKYTLKSLLILNRLLEIKEADQDVEISITLGKELTFFRIADIVRLEADMHSTVPITIFYLDNGNEHFSTKRFSYFENLLIPFGFTNCTPYILVNKFFYNI